ncbi:MAG: excinuclease ABC subunit UvrC, partial [bacterium]
MGRFREWPPEILEKVRSLPDAPGVYRMRDKRGRILYIGKALSLRDRVSSYFNKSPKHGPNIEYMLGRLEDFDVMLTRTENEAFILEASLIKQFQPKYNILLKDDKEYPYIKITTNEPYPRLLVTRSVADDGSRYFGPYTSVNAMRMALRFISNLFNLRTCSLDLDGKKFIPKPCLDYHLKLCSGPCADLINRDDYGGLVRQAIKFFSGSESEVQSEIERMMYEASEARRYEAAARFRDVLYAVKRTRDRHRLWGRPDDFFDALGYAYSEKTAVVMVLPVRGGRVLGELEFKMENELEEEPGVILASFIQQYYSNREHIQPEILLPLEIPAAPAAAEWLTSLLGRSVHLKVPRRGPRADLVRMVMENAAERLKSRLLRAPGEFVITPGVSRVKELLSLPFYPRRIEGYDISHHRGKETVGSMVVFTDGSPDNRAYRSFTIRGKTAGDDLKALSEVLRRRLLRFLSDDKWHFPDTLLLIDGGRTQLDAALAVVRELKLEYPAGLRHDGASFENGDGGAPAGPDETKAADSEDLDSADT